MKDNATLMGRLKAFLDSDDWNYNEDVERGALFSGVRLDSADFRVVFGVKEDLEIIIFYVVSPQYVPEPQRVRAAEYLTRANYGLNVGNFEMDFNDGEVRYKTSVDVEGVEWGDKCLQNLIGTGVQTMTRYFNGLMSVCFSEVAPAEALRVIESGEGVPASPGLSLVRDDVLNITSLADDEPN